MSVLRDRIVAQPAAGGPGQHPVGTGATPMTMPMAEVAYTGATALYGTLHPLVTADGAVIPARCGCTSRRVPRWAMTRSTRPRKPSPAIRRWA